MKLIHCADLHLDSKMTANLDKDRAKERKAELLLTFERMVEYAVQNEVCGILIAGDLFDTKNISATARRVVENAIRNHPQITFYYLKGNHDVDNFLSSMEEIPENLKLFGDSWVTYPLDESGRIRLSGVELDEGNSGNIYNSLNLSLDHLNIVTLHGQEFVTTVKDKAEIIPMNELRNKGIDYLALGHVHSYKMENLDNRGKYAYSGCLEGRGFDECGEHGFVLLTIDEEKLELEATFVPFASRKLYEVIVNVDGCLTTGDVAQNIEEELQKNPIGREHLVKFILRGSLDVSAELDVPYLVRRFEPKFYFLKIYNETVLQVKAEDYALESSLKGEFVRTVMGQEDLSEEEKAEIIRFGLQAIQGEEIGE